ncbi:hypothetical protein V6N11_068049 [Hibiscus sabdariffa]|uniref:Uncharacterized protein n=1 Tax=Hibiscus sabdariffa TaxID=183260 RepID=A0ABR2STG0_9ROSI
MDVDIECKGTPTEHMEIPQRSGEAGVGQHDTLRPQPASYAAVVSEGLRIPNLEVTDGFVGDSVEILVEDIIVNSDATIPSIQFSDRVHDQIDHNMLIPRSHVLWERTRRREFKTRLRMEKMSVDIPEEVSESNLYGPWMVVDRRRRSGQNSLANRNVTHGAEGSRFSVLQEVEDVRMVGSVEDCLPLERVDTPILVQQQHPVGKSQQLHVSGVIRLEAYLASNPYRKSKVGKKLRGLSTIPLQNSQGATVVTQQAVIPSGSHQVVRIIEGEGQVQPITSMKAQRLKGAASKGSIDTMHHGVKVSKSATPHVLSKISLAKLARHLSKQLDVCDPRDRIMLTHSFDDDVAFLAEF